MQKRLCALLLSCVLLLTLSLPALAAEPGLANFKATASYRNGQFTDVSESDWFAASVATAYRLGLMKGASETWFNAGGNVTIAETITLAVRLHSTYETGACELPSGSPWYQPYVDYALEHQLIERTYADYQRPATRAEYAVIVGKAFPDEALRPINEVEDGAIPDVPMTRSYAQAVYRLYRAGILSGSDAKGTFNPDSNIRRSEVAALIARMADESQRREYSLAAPAAEPTPEPTPMPTPEPAPEPTAAPTVKDAVTIARECSPAVFFVEICDASGRPIQTGSGFFIDSSGVAVTNYHVIDGGSSATAVLTNGERHAVLGVYDCSPELDLALLKIDGSGFPVLETCNDAPPAGATVYAIGSPNGLDNSISQGIVANPARSVDGIDYIQFTAPISSGSSGGALINDMGQVIGVSTSTFVGSETSTVQNLNLALPVSLISRLGRDSYVPLSQVTGTASGDYGDWDDWGDWSDYDDDGWIYVENAEVLAVGVGEELEIPVYFHYSDAIYIIWDCPDGSEYYADVEWGEFEDDWIPAYITGKHPGFVVLQLDLYNHEQTVFLDEIMVCVEIVDAELTVSDSEPELYVGESMVLTFCTDVGNSDTTIYLTCEAEDDSVVDMEWGEWDGMDIDMTVTALRRGSTLIYVEMYDSYDNYLTGGYVPVTVY